MAQREVVETGGVRRRLRKCDGSQAHFGRGRQAQKTVELEMGGRQAPLGRIVPVVGIEGRGLRRLHLVRRLVPRFESFFGLREQGSQDVAARAVDLQLTLQRQDTHALQPGLTGGLPLSPRQIVPDLAACGLLPGQGDAALAQGVEIEAERRSQVVQPVRSGQQDIFAGIERRVGQEAGLEYLGITDLGLNTLRLEVGIGDDRQGGDGIAVERLGEIDRHRFQVFAPGRAGQLRQCRSCQHRRL